MPNPDERLKVFKNMAEKDPANELAHFSLGKIHFEAGDLAAAERSLRRTLELSPEHAQAHRFLGETLLKLGRNDEAVTILKVGIGFAHAKGEFQPRNQMQEVLRKAGVEPPMPQAAARAGTGAGASVAGPSARSTPGGAATAATAAAGAWTCRRCGRPNPRMEEAPFLNDLGNRIYETICQPCWREWFAMSIKVINEYRLNLLNPEHNRIYETHMKEFLGVEG